MCSSLPVTFLLHVFNTITVMRLVMHKLIMLSLAITLCIQVINMKWAARKCYLVRRHDVWVFSLSTHCVQDGRAFVKYVNPAGLSAFLLSDKERKLVLCEMCSWLESMPCLLEYDILYISSARHVAEPLNEKNEAFHSKCISPVTSLLMSRNWACGQKCKVWLQNALSVQDILNAVGASVIQEPPVVCKWVALLVFLSIDSYIYCVNDTWS